MKLYTEEQVRKVLWEFGDLLFNNCQHGIKEDDIKIYSDWAIEDEATIELPSDEEIRKMSLPTNVGDSYHSEYIKGFNYGAKWVIEQIKEQDNGGSRD